LDRMLALDPQLRFQTPQQLHDAIRAVQSELSGGPAVNALTPTGPRTVYVVEKREQFQQKMREKFRSLGFKVLLSSNAEMALHRFRQQPFQGLLLDVGTVGTEALDVFDSFRREVERQRARCASIVLLSDEQIGLRHRITECEDTVVLLLPLKKGELD